MEIFQTIWTALSTPNPTLIQILGIPFVFIEITVTMLLFTTVLNISASKQKKYRYVLLISVLSIISNNFIPNPYGVILHIFITPIIIIFFFKTSLLKAIIAEVFPVIIIALLETIFVKLFAILFNMSFETVSTVPIYRNSLVLIIYFIIYLIYKILDYFKFQFISSSIDSITTKNKVLLLVTFIFAIISMGVQFYLITFYIDKLPLSVTLIGISTLIVYVVISIYSLIKTTTLAIVNQDLEQTKLYNNTLQILHDNMRAFKHDFANIVQAIGRICRYERYGWTKKLLFSTIR